MIPKNEQLAQDVLKTFESALNFCKKQNINIAFQNEFGLKWDAQNNKFIILNNQVNVFGALLYCLFIFNNIKMFEGFDSTLRTALNLSNSEYAALQNAYLHKGSLYNLPSEMEGYFGPIGKELYLVSLKYYN